MEIKLADAVQIVVIAGFIGGVFKYFIIDPLGKAIAALNDTIDDLKKAIENTERARQAMDIRLTRVEESAKSAHHRIDHIEEKEMKGKQ